MAWNDYLSAIGVAPQYSMPAVAGQLSGMTQGMTQGQGLTPGAPSTSGMLPQAPTASQVFANAQLSGGLASPTGAPSTTPGFGNSQQPNPALPSVPPPSQSASQSQPPQDPLNGLSPIQSSISDALKKLGNPDVSHAIPLGNSQFMGIDGSIIGPQDGAEHGGSSNGVLSLPNAMNPSPFNQQSLPQALSNFAFTPQTNPWSAPSGSSLSQGAGQPGDGLKAFMSGMNKGSLA